MSSGYDSVLREAHSNFMSQHRIDIKSGEGMAEIVGDPAIRREYIASLAEGMGPDNKELFEVLAENTLGEITRESSLGSIQTVSALSLPMLRQAIPMMGAKNAMPTTPLKVPSTTIPVLIAYVQNEDGSQIGIPQVIQNGRRTGTSAVDSTRIGGDGVRVNIGAENVRDQIVAKFPNSVVMTDEGLDVDIRITRALVTVGSVHTGKSFVAGAGDGISDLEKVTVSQLKAPEGSADVVGATGWVDVVGKVNRQTGQFAVTLPRLTHKANPAIAAINANAGVHTAVSAIAVDGLSYQDGLMFFGTVNFETGEVHSGSAPNVHLSLTSYQGVHAFEMEAHIDTTLQRNATTISMKNQNVRIDVGSAEIIQAPLPIEWLQDNMAAFGIDATIKVVNAMTEYVAGTVDDECLEFIANTACNDEPESFLGVNRANRGDLREKSTAKYDLTIQTFDVLPPGRFNGTVQEWVKSEFPRVVDLMASKIKNKEYVTNGFFAVVGNPIDMSLITGINWQISNGDEVDGVQAPYAFGVKSGAHSYKFFSTQTLKAPDSGETGWEAQQVAKASGSYVASAGDHTMWMFFVPSQEDMRSLEYYPYSFNVSRTSMGFALANTPNVPGISMSKRHTFEAFTKPMGAIVIKNNNGEYRAGTGTADSTGGRGAVVNS
jgi:hypothetical protein